MARTNTNTTPIVETNLGTSLTAKEKIALLREQLGQMPKEESQPFDAAAVVGVVGEVVVNKAASVVDAMKEAIIGDNSVVARIQVGYLQAKVERSNK